MIESGERWWHVEARTSELDSSYYLRSEIRHVVNNGLLPKFARTAEEMALFDTNNVTELLSPKSDITDHGYNSGNLLIGKL